VLTLKFINPRYYTVDTMSSGQETRTKSLAEEAAQEIYNAIRSLNSEASWEILRALELPWRFWRSCPCGARLHHLVEFLGHIIEIESFENLEPGARIKLRWVGGEHIAYIFRSEDIPHKLERLLRNKESVLVVPRLKLDLEVK